MEPLELAQLVSTCRQAAASLGTVTYGGTQAEQDFKKYRRSIYISKDSKAGDILNDTNIQIIRPSLGLAPKFWPDVLGKALIVDASKGDALAWDMLEDVNA
jgi:N-acetylneuraminate synthase